MPFDAQYSDNGLLQVILERVIRAESIALEGLVLQARAYTGLYGGDVADIVQAAETRAAHRAETMLRQLRETGR